MKHFKVQVPEGYEIDQEKSTFEKIVFKPVESKPTWDDFGKVSGWYIRSDSKVARSGYVTSGDINKSTWPSKGEAEACLALSQLCQWRDKYNEGWKPDWANEDQPKWVIVYCKDEIDRYRGHAVAHPLSFKTVEIRDKFIEDFKDLIEVAKPLL